MSEIFTFGQSCEQVNMTVMAKYHITALNYMNFGSKRVFFNFDTKLSYDLPITAFLLSNELTGEEGRQIGDIRTESEYTKLSTNFIQTEGSTPKPVSEENNNKSIILNERQDCIEALDSNQGEIIRLYKSINTEEFNRKLREFNQKTISLGNTFFAEFSPFESQFKNWFDVSSSQDYTEFYSMYDIVDTSIKSRTNIGYRNDKIDAEDVYQNVFVPDMKQNPIGFCQVNNGKLVYTYMATSNMDKDPYMYSSQLKTQRQNEQKMSYYEIILESEKTGTLTYMTPSELGYSTYKDFLSSVNQPLSVFEPVRNMRGIDRNYILEIPDSELSSEYDTGNVHAGLYVGKNPINALYSMEMSSMTSIQNTRRYCGIGQSANRVYLKFYDSVDYNGTQDDGENLKMARNESKKMPYQKIEFFNKNVFTNRCKHKSNLFSIKIEDLEQLSENSVADENSEVPRVDYHPDQNSERVVRKIRDDIYFAVKKIVENVCPVNTQLFKVYFGSM